MTNRIHSLTVVLAENIREDDIKQLENAIHQLKHVIAVEHNIADSATYMAEQRAFNKLRKKLWDVLYPEHEGLLGDNDD